ncbi:ABC transporter ATP-binding protein [Rathayibacter sp. CAU 1779]
MSPSTREIPTVAPNRRTRRRGGRPPVTGHRSDDGRPSAAVGSTGIRQEPHSPASGQGPETGTATAASAPPGSRAVPGRTTDESPAQARDAAATHSVGAEWRRRILPLLIRHRVLVGSAMGLAAVYAVLVSMLPWIQQVIVDDAIVKHDVPILPWLIVMGSVGLVVLGLSFSWRYLGAKASYAVQYDMRNGMYDALQKLDFAGHSQLQSGQLVSRASSDLLWVQILIGWFPQLVSTIVGALVSVVVMVTLSPILAAIVVVIIAGVFVVTQRMRRNAHAAGWQAQQLEADMTTQVEESMTGVRVVRGFGQEAQESGRLHGALRDMYRARVRAIRLRAPFSASLATGPQLGIAVILLVGGVFVLMGDIQVGVFLAFTGYLTGLAGSAQTVGMVLSNMPQCEAAIERIGQVLDLAPTLTEVQDPISPERSDGEIVFEDVDFRYDESDDRPVLAGFSLRVAPGESVALVGTIGSGKSTLNHLVPRFYDVDGGRVLVDGVDVREQPIARLRSRVGVVFENSFLFSDTIASNIAYGVPDATPATIERAARAAMAHDFIMETPDGYDTIIGEQGMTLSGGQRQRVALARAILTDPEILLLDDATSSVDVSVERDIHANLGPFLDARTTIIIAYRESTVRMADRVVLMDAGRVADTGTHEELFERSALYRELFGDLASDDDSDAGALLEDARTGRFAASPVAWHPSRPQQAGLLDLSTSPAVKARIAALPEFHDEPGVDMHAESKNREPFRLGRFLRPYGKGFAVGLVFVVIQVLIGLVNPLIIRQGVDAGMLGKSVPMLLVVFVIAVLLTVALFFDQRNAQLWTQRTSERLLLAMRTRVYGQLQRLGIDFYDRTQTGRIMTRMTSDIDSIGQLFQTGVINLIMAVLTFAGMAVVISVLDWRLALVVLCVIPLAAGVTWWYRRIASVAYDELRERASMLNTDLAESMAGIRVTQAYRREARNLDDFAALGRQFIWWAQRSAFANTVYVASVEFLSTAATIAVLGVGFLLIQTGGLGIGTLLAFLLYLAQVFAPVQQMSTVFDAYQRARAGLVRIRELLGLPSSTPESLDPQPVERLVGDIRLEGVRLRYAGTTTDALSRVDLHVPAGQRVAFVGQTGAGKSTTIKLVTRFYDPTEGRILVDGKDLQSLDSAEYRHRLGYVPQEPFLFTRSVRDNIAYAVPDATDAEVEAAARIVGAHEFISRLPGGYHEIVTERGRSLSNGQRQLICLARALIVDPRILILDEATSNLDLSSERRVDRAMRLIARGRTTLVVTHRPQSLHWVQRVLVVSAGRIVDDTTPDDYLERMHELAEA